MKDLKNIISFLVIILTSIAASAQLKNYSIENAHSHNDYLNPASFYLAYKSGFGSIETDVFATNGILHVAHKREEIRPRNTLQQLYLEPILHGFDSTGPRKLNLLIDIKEDYTISLPLIIKELQSLKPYLSTLGHPNFLTIIITGNRPPPAGYKDFPDFIFFDDDLKLPHTKDEWQRVALVSLPFNKISDWTGENTLRRKDRKVLKHIIDSVHTAGKLIRFWAAPDTETSWKWQMKLRADLIGTDKITELGNYLRKENGH